MSKTRFGIPHLVNILYNDNVEDGRIVSSFIQDNEVYHNIELIDKKFHNPCTIIKIKDSDKTLKENND